ncbi:hypothetical protein SDC9_134386 [bioreactor metagenome]|uniref:Uncharacterized protein n=1 Tax=bioreactor metagenome TaxID=1076179 RepID=A0A645DCS9_9ZZZZ
MTGHQHVRLAAGVHRDSQLSDIATHRRVDVLEGRRVGGTGGGRGYQLRGGRIDETEITGVRALPVGGHQQRLGGRRLGAEQIAADRLQPQHLLGGRIDPFHRLPVLIEHQRRDHGGCQAHDHQDDAPPRDHRGRGHVRAALGWSRCLLSRAQLRAAAGFRGRRGCEAGGARAVPRGRRGVRHSVSSPVRSR